VALSLGRGRLLGGRQQLQHLGSRRGRLLRPLEAWLLRWRCQLVAWQQLARHHPPHVLELLVIGGVVLHLRVQGGLLVRQALRGRGREGDPGGFDRWHSIG
jgi:hypothetical protein